jgi:hypothetical protein
MRKKLAVPEDFYARSSPGALFASSVNAKSLAASGGPSGADIGDGSSAGVKTALSAPAAVVAAPAGAIADIGKGRQV